MLRKVSFLMFPGFFVFVAALLLLSSFLWGKGAPVEKARSLNFSLQNLSGKRVSFEDFRGRPVVLNFWATWCSPCVAEMPALNRLSEAYREKGVSVVGINVGESSEKVGPFIKKLGISFDILLDKNGVVESKYHVMGIPTTFFIDRKGYIKDVAVGGGTYSMFEGKLKSVL